MDTSKEVIFPNELLNDMSIEQTFFPSNSDEVGVAVLSHVENEVHIMRIYQLVLSMESNAFEPIQEMVSFAFESRKELIDFLERLPNLTGLEMLMLLNPISTDFNNAH